MKWSIFLFAFSILAISACDYDGWQKLNIDQYYGTSKQEFNSYQIARFNPGPLADNISIYEGEFGGVPIKAGKTDLNEVVFVVPDLPAGSYQLKLKIGYPYRIWDVTLVNQPIGVDNFSSFWSDYFEGNEEIYDSLKKYSFLESYAEDAKLWSNYLANNLSGLTQNEKNELIHIIHRNDFENFIPYFFEAPGNFVNCLEEHFAPISLNSVDEGVSQKASKVQLVYLPPSKINDALQAFTCDLVWRHHSIFEILAPRVKACSILREVKLTTFRGPVGIEPINLNSGDSLGFKLTSVYSPLSEWEGSLKINGMDFRVDFLDIAKNQMKADGKMIAALIEKNHLELPYFSIFPRFDFGWAPITEKKLTDFSFEIDAISNPDIILSKKYQHEDQVFLTFEKKTKGYQDFQFTVNFFQSGFSVAKQINAKMTDIPELILNLSFYSGTANIQIFSGEPPFDIVWSTGVTEETSLKFTAGNYSVKVTDANGSEKVMDFSIPEFGTVQDREGNEYQTVKIGNQWWMAENLRNTIRDNGKPIPEREIWPAWNPNMPPDFDYKSFSYYQNDPENDKRYGKLYNNACCLCPEGWELPTLEDFTKLANELGGLDVAGIKLKSRSTWKESIFNSTNESGFNAKPGGMKYGSQNYKNEDSFVGWWLADENYSNQVVFLESGSNALRIVEYVTFFFDGHYARCIKKE